MDQPNAASDKRFSFKKELDFGSVLTSLSILVSVSALLLSWNNDNGLRTKEYADRIRRSTSVVTAKLERWGELSQRYFEDIQPTVVDVSEKVAETHNRQPANRMLYKGLMDASAKASQRIVDEQLQVSYMELYGYVPELQSVFDKTINEIKKAEADSHTSLSESLQGLLADQRLLNLSSSPDIGNQMRSRISAEQQNLTNKIQNITQPLRSKMLRLIQLPDKDLADASQRSVISKSIAAEKTEIPKPSESTAR